MGLRLPIGSGRGGSVSPDDDLPKLNIQIN